uniref:Uncharacterized protein n=1 Tax=Heterorhabditis bacteriophora TaxID=37862 RepID=A0A1I7W804_HETBA
MSKKYLLCKNKFVFLQNVCSETHFIKNSCYLN